MRGDIHLLEQLLVSMSDAVMKLEQFKEQNKIEDFNRAKELILDLQGKVNMELSKEFI